MDWRHRAACRDEDPELFFPVGTSGPALLQIAEAKAVCHRCTVASQCLTLRPPHQSSIGLIDRQPDACARAAKSSSTSNSRNSRIRPVWPSRK